MARLTRKVIDEWRVSLLRENTDDDPEGRRKSQSNASPIVCGIGNCAR